MNRGGNKKKEIRMKRSQKNAISDEQKARRRVHIYAIWKARKMVHKLMRDIFKRYRIELNQDEVLCKITSRKKEILPNE